MALPKDVLDLIQTVNTNNANKSGPVLANRALAAAKPTAEPTLSADQRQWLDMREDIVKKFGKTHGATRETAGEFVDKVMGGNPMPDMNPPPGAIDHVPMVEDPAQRQLSRTPIPTSRIPDIDDLDRLMGRYQYLSRRRLGPGGLTDTERMEYNKLVEQLLRRQERPIDRIIYPTLEI